MTGNTVKAIRLWLGLSQREMAVRLGVTDSYLSQIEAGRPVSDTIRIKIAQTFDVTADMLEAIRRAKLADQFLV